MIIFRVLFWTLCLFEAIVVGLWISTTDSTWEPYATLINLFLGIAIFVFEKRKISNSIEVSNSEINNATGHGISIKNIKNKDTKISNTIIRNSGKDGIHIDGSE